MKIVKLFCQKKIFLSLIILFYLLYSCNTENNNNRIKKVNLLENIKEINYSIPVYYGNSDVMPDFGSVYYYEMSSYEPDIANLYKFINNDKFKDNKQNFLEIYYVFYVISKIDTNILKNYTKLEHKRFFVNIGIDSINKNDSICDYAYFIMWSNNSHSILNEINENTDTLISNLPLSLISKIYPKFKGNYIKSNVKKLTINDYTNYKRGSSFVNNIKFDGDNYINKLLIDRSFELYFKYDSIVNIISKKLSYEFKMKYNSKHDIIQSNYYYDNYHHNNNKNYTRHYIKHNSLR